MRWFVGGHEPDNWPHSWLLSPRSWPTWGLSVLVALAPVRIGGSPYFFTSAAPPKKRARASGKPATVQLPDGSYLPWRSWWHPSFLHLGIAAGPSREETFDSAEPPIRLDRGPRSNGVPRPADPLG